MNKSERKRMLCVSLAAGAILLCGGMLDRTIASAYIESVIDGKGRMGGV